MGLWEARRCLVTMITIKSIFIQFITLPNLAANLRWTRRPLVPSNIMALGIGMVGCCSSSSLTDIHDFSSFINWECSTSDVTMKYCESIGHDHDVSALPTERVISVSEERWTMIFIIIFRRGQLTRMERSINQTSTQPEVDRRIFQWLWWCCLWSMSHQTFQTGVFMFELRSGTVCVWLCSVWVCACIFHLSSSIPDRGLYVWAEIGDSLCVAVFCVGVCAYVPSQLKHSRQGSLCLSWDGDSLCVAVWVCVPMFHLSSNIRDRGLYVWAEIGDSLCVALCCVGVCVYVPSQLKHSRQGSLCLSWAGQRPVAVSQSLTQCTCIISLLPSTCL